MFKKCPCGKKNCSCRQDLGLFLVRLALALVFIIHGWGKFANMQATIGFFAQLGFPVATAYLVATVELLSGIAMLLGVATLYAGVLLAVVMAVASFKVKLGQGFVGGYELDVTLLLSALGIAAAGAGRINVKKLFSKSKENKNTSQESRETSAS